jgi:hemerythrin-like metal-binding protein
MSSFEWKPEYSVCVGRFDAEHQQLFSFINQLNCAMQEGEGRQAVSTILQELAAYTRNHFEAEEIAMRSAGYPGLEEHIIEHRKLTGKMTAYFAEYDANSSTIDVDLLMFLGQWLQDHILICDRQYGAALNAAGIQ